MMVHFTTTSRRNQEEMFQRVRLQNMDRSDLLVVINVNGEGDSVAQSVAVADIVSEIKRRLGEREAIPNSISIANLHMDRDLHEVTRGGNPIHLSPLEFSLLERLLLHQDRLQTESALMDALFGGAEKGYNTLWVHMHRLRKKIDRHGEVRLIYTIRGVGYVLKTPREGETR